MNSKTHEDGTIPQLHDLADFRYQLRKFLSFSETASESCGIPAQQYQLLQVVGSAPTGQPATISYLAERMILRHNSTVELVDRAERAGLVERKHDAQDLRRSLVHMTAHGHDVLKQLVAMHLGELQMRAPAIIAAIGNLVSGTISGGGE